MRAQWLWGLSALALSVVVACSSDDSNGTASSGGKGGSAGKGANGGKGGASGKGGTGGSGGSSDSGTGGATPVHPPFDWVGIIGTGQSLSVGATANYMSVAQPYGNLTLVDNGPDPKYVIDAADTSSYATVPLVEPIRAWSAGSGEGYDDGQYPNNIAGETPHSGMANQITAFWKARPESVGDYVTVHSVVGWSGHPLVDIDKQGGKRAYPASLHEGKIFKDLATKAGKSFGYGAIVLTHGESDAGNPDYGTGLFTLFQDYNADLKALTGQSSDVPLLVSQQSTIASGPTGSAVQVFQAGVDHPGQIVCTGPKYAYQYSGDYLHLPAPGYFRLGEKYAEVFDKIVNQKLAWKPLGPKKATRSGATITIDFDVPTPPLVFDENISPPHQSAHTAWAKGRGFEVVDSQGGEIEISDASIQGSSVVLTLANAPSAGTPLSVRYAVVQDGSGTQGGLISGLIGQLRDSNDVTGYDAESIACKVETGQKFVTSSDPGGFARRTGFDRVSGGSLSATAIVVHQDSDDQITLSEAWTGASGAVNLSFHHDLFNYCVHFAIDVG